MSELLQDLKQVTYPLPDFLFFIFFIFLGLHLQHMEVPRLGIESELQQRGI